ncbi:DNA starvation/stationary phase protection protein [Crocinitomicaceae bacterium]|nr:DNA starvation/stationary phase protection protein [Crocinitomicaceae bacterium]
MQLERTHKKLGLRGLEAVEIVENLNTSLSSYQIFYHKMQNFHWNVEGPDFFDIHDITEKLYKESMKNIDTIAERVRLLGGVPNYRLSDYINNSKIVEDTHDLSGDNIKVILLEDVETLLKVLSETADYSINHNDYGTVHVMQEMIHGLEMMHYKLQSWLK